mgnify:CR=1 FL=1
MNKIRKIDSSKTAPTDARGTWGPFTAGFEWDGNTGVNTAVGHVFTDKPGDLVAVATRYKASYVELFDDFLGDTLRTDIWGVFSGSDSQAVDPVVTATAGVSGTLSMVAGDDSTTTMAVNGTQINGDLNWKANQGELFFETRLKVSAITNIVLFAGFTDQVAALEMPFTLSGTTLTSNATNAVGFLFDTGATTDDFWGQGVAADTDASQISTSTAPVADTFIRLGVKVASDGEATYFINGTQVGTAQASAVTATVALAPVIAFFTESAASATATVDYIVVSQGR